MLKRILESRKRKAMFLLTMAFTMLMSTVAQASGDPVVAFDVVPPITAGMNSLVTQVTAIIGAVAPGAIAIVGSVIAIRLAINVFRSLVGR